MPKLSSQVQAAELGQAHAQRLWELADQHQQNRAAEAELLHGDGLQAWSPESRPSSRRPSSSTVPVLLSRGLQTTSRGSTSLGAREDSGAGHHLLCLHRPTCNKGQRSLRVKCPHSAWQVAAVAEVAPAPVLQSQGKVAEVTGDGFGNSVLIEATILIWTGFVTVMITFWGKSINGCCLIRV